MVGVNQGCDDMKDKIRILVIEGEALSTVVMPRLLILDGFFDAQQLLDGNLVNFRQF